MSIGNYFPTRNYISINPQQPYDESNVAEGKTSKDIATMLDLGLQTVRTYRKTLMKKIGVTNVASLTQVALAAGLTRLARSSIA